MSLVQPSLSMSGGGAAHHQWSQAISTADSTEFEFELSDDSSIASAALQPPPGCLENDDNGVAWGKNPAWRLPSDGIEVTTPVMMGEISWPALSESISPKSSISFRLASPSDESISTLPAPPVRRQPPPINPNPRSTPNHASDGGGASCSIGLLANDKPALPEVSMKMPPPAADKQEGLVPTPRGPPNKDKSNLDNTARVDGFALQPRQGGDYHRNYGGNLRGIGGRPHHNTSGNRRYQDHGSYGWRPLQGFGGGGTHALHTPYYQVHLQPFFRPPIHPPDPSPPFFSPSPHLQPFVNHMGFPDISPYACYVPTHPPPGWFRRTPVVPHPVPHANSPTVVNPVDCQRAIIKQIDYYFSEENLCHDLYLRMNMDDHGWVPASLIAGFKKVKELTEDRELVLDALQSSTTVEVQGGKIRRRQNWMKWILQPSFRLYSNTTYSQSLEIGNHETLVAHMQNIGLEGSTTTNSIMSTTTTTADGELNEHASKNCPIKLQVGDPDGEVDVQNQISGS